MIHMGRLIDLTGQRFGRLTVVSRAENTMQGKPKWFCVCDCGNTLSVSGDCLKRGNTKSCGCLKNEIIISRNKKHGLSKNPLYAIWCGIKHRVSDEDDTDYGGRGIDICEEWENDFQAFYDWAILNGYKRGLTIDRIDNDKGYYPYNCRWANNKAQQNNKRNNLLITYHGETRTLAEWAEITNIAWATLRTRIVELNWSIEKALTTPVRKRRKKSNS